jgi:hypothetical protein
LRFKREITLLSNIELSRVVFRLSNQSQGKNIMLQTAQHTHNAHILTSNEKFNFLVAVEISADEITPIEFSKSRLWKHPRYGLFVEIRLDGILYTIRKNSKLGYNEIIERDSCFEAIQDAWVIYLNA